MTHSVVRIVVAGGNYAGLSALKQLYATLLATPSRQANVQITMVDRRDGFLHYIGMTRGITEPEFGSRLWVPYATVDWLRDPQITIKQDRVIEIQPEFVQLAGGGRLEFDYLVVALGQSRHGPIGVAANCKREFVGELAKSYEQLRAAKSVTVVGGGAVGIEMAADIKSDFPKKAVTLVHSRALPLPGPFKDEFRSSVVRILRDEIGVDLVLGQRVVAQNPASADMMNQGEHEPESVLATASNAALTLGNGHVLQSDWAVRCLGTFDKCSVVNLPSSTDEPVFGGNGIRVKDTMQIDDPKYPNIYACGDICNRDQVKLAGVAMHGAYIAATNIARSVLSASPTLEQSARFPPKILLLLGKSHFIMQLGDEIWEREKTQQYVSDDMSLRGCVEALSMHQPPEAISAFDSPQTY
ncbi:hypothetical protein IWW55_002632 [Coemansia sp. RSA 2706]|nr:hypothetical protein IWW55_002632 [Coemansia sp. RSA 2706]KAJ2327943.1 hypothetical protein IWW51_001466 [Coemansia sp. RSA 2702]KAJ2364730.1 hypothetical protein H4S01_003623 [Coemansia sp. RSA 2610]KAJ2386027.1 hypothetical protein H4S02_004048 [Coemansia sp. RSA 2611]